MPRYFVDFDDGRAGRLDTVETDAFGLEALRDEVMQTLADTARFGVTCGGEQLLIATIRDDVGQELCRIMLALTCAWLGQQAPRSGVG